MRNRYLLFLQNNFSNEQFCFEVFNASCDPEMYVFEDFNNTIPYDFKYGCYDYALLHCSIPYGIEWHPCLLDTRIILHDDLTDTDKVFTLRDLKPDTGMLEFRPDNGLNCDSETWETVEGNDRLYINM